MANCLNIYTPADSGGTMSCAQLQITLDELKIICAELNALRDVVNVEIVAPGSGIFVAGEMAGFFTVPSYLNGKSLDIVNVSCRTAGTGGTLDFDVRKNGGSVTSLSLGTGVAYIEGTGLAEAVATGDVIDINVTTMNHTSPPFGMNLVLIFQ